MMTVRAIFRSFLLVLLLVVQALAAPPNVYPTPACFVSPQGNDNWSGKSPDPRENDGPFATVERARDAVRAFLKTQKEPRAVSVMLRAGTYYLKQSLEFG